MVFFYESFTAWKPAPLSESAWKELHDDAFATQLGSYFLKTYFLSGVRTNLPRLAVGLAGLALIYVGQDSVLSILGFGLSIALLGWVTSVMSLLCATAITHYKWRRLVREAKRATTYQQFLLQARGAQCLNLSRLKPVLSKLVVDAGGRPGQATEAQFLHAVAENPHLQMRWPALKPPTFRY